MAKKPKEQNPGIIVKIPADEVATILEVMEQTLEDIYESSCDCDDCAHTVVVLEDLIEKILQAAPVKT